MKETWNCLMLKWMHSWLMIITLICMPFTQLQASYILLYSTNDNGALSFTGNTLGLNKKSNENQPGTSGSIGAFITTNNALTVGNYPSGTTLNFALNKSTAVLDIPAGSTILHAELIWSGSYGFGSSITLNLVNSTSVTLITPDAVSHTIAPRVDTAQSRVDSRNNGFYVRTADVTSLVSGGGTYTVGGVPGSLEADENNLNCCGWTLAVAYRNPNMFTSNLTLFTACEASGADPALISGFYAPDSGSVVSRIFVSCLEGDAAISGDHLLIGSSSSLNYPADAISGTNNPIDNFFASQINTLLPLTTDIISGKLVASGSSVLDTRGSFGLTNSNASTGTGVSGARQGYDITSIDLAGKISNSQQTLYAQGTTTGDVYTINSLGLQIQVQAPILQSVKSVSAENASLNDILTYTITLKNIGLTNASSLIFTDILPTGLTLVPGTFKVNDTLVNLPNLNTGVNIGNLAMNATTTIVFDVEVTQINPPTSYSNVGAVSYSFVPFNGADPIVLISETNSAIVTANSNPPPLAHADTGITNANTPLNGTTVLANDTGTGIAVSIYDVASAQGGTIFMQTNGAYLYTPAGGFSGTDTFHYTIKDSQNQTSTTTVTMTVLPLADNDSAIVAANTTLNQLMSVLNNDVGTGLTVSAYDVTSAQGGSVVMQVNGTYVYHPMNGFSGTDTFNYTATDSSGHTTSATVTITVLPVAENDLGTTPANTPLNGSTVFTNDIGTGLTIIAYDATSANGGTVVMNTATGTYVYTPLTGFSGLDTFRYTVTDQIGDPSQATVTISVLPVANNNTGTTNVNTVFNQFTSVLGNDVGSALSVSSYDHTSLHGGTIVMQTNGTYVYTPPLNYSGQDSFDYTLVDGSGNHATAAVVITVFPYAINDSAMGLANTALVGSSVLVNDSGLALTVTSFQNPSTQGGFVSVNINGTYTYIPPLNFSGIDTFTYTTTDSSGHPTSAMVTITVLPVAYNDTATILANTVLNGSTVFSNDAGTGLSITAYDVTSLEGGHVLMNMANGMYVYNPPLGFSGLDTFTYTVMDSYGDSTSATVTITVLPVAHNDTGNTTVNTMLNQLISVLANDVGTSLSISAYDHTSWVGGAVVMQPNGTYTYTPPLDYSGTDTFNYTAIDALGNPTSAMVTITVGIAPIVANNDAGSVPNGATGGIAVPNVLVNDTLNDHSVTLANVNLSEVSTDHPNVTLNPATGAVIVAPATPAGTYHVVYEICEKMNPTNCDQATVTVTVGAAPIVAHNDSGIVPDGANGGTAVPNVLLNDALNGDVATLANVNLSQISTDHPNVTLNPATGAVNVAPGTAAGTYHVVYEICEKLNPENCSQASVTVTVGAAPIIANTDNGSVSSGASGGMAVPNVLINDTLNGVSATLATVNLSQVSTDHPNVTLNPATGAVVVAPGTPAGTYHLVYEICEKLNPENCSQATVVVIVGAAPIIAVPDAGMIPDGAIGGTAVPNVLVNDTLDGAPATLATVNLSQISTDNPNITLDPTTGAIHVAPGTAPGTYHVVYEICEQLNPDNCNQATVTVVVREVPLPPIHPLICQIKQEFPTETDLINILSWSPPLSGSPPVSYRIYRDPGLTLFVVEVLSTDPLIYADHKQNHQPAVYYIVSVDANGQASVPVEVTLNSTCKCESFRCSFLDRKPGLFKGNV